MRLIETGLQTADGWGSDSLTVGTYGRKPVSYLSSGLHFDLDQSAQRDVVQAAGGWSVSTFLHSCFFRSLACFLSQPFLLTLLYLTDIFRWCCQWGLHFSTLYFNVLDRMQTTVKQSFAFSCALTHAVCNIARWGCYFSVSLELVKGWACSQAPRSPMHPRDLLKDNLCFLSPHKH